MVQQAFDIAACDGASVLERVVREYRNTFFYTVCSAGTVKSNFIEEISKRKNQISLKSLPFMIFTLFNRL